MCSLLTQPAHRVEVLCTGIILHPDTAKQRLAFGRFTTLILGTQMLPSYYQYYMITCLKLLLNYYLLLPMPLGIAIKLGQKKKKKAVSEL